MGGLRVSVLGFGGLCWILGELGEVLGVSGEFGVCSGFWGACGEGAWSVVTVGPGVLWELQGVMVDLGGFELLCQALVGSGGALRVPGAPPSLQFPRRQQRPGPLHRPCGATRP